MIPESHENEYSISLSFTFFSVFLVWLTFRRLTLESCHSAGIPSSGALFYLIFGIYDLCKSEITHNFFAEDSGKFPKSRSVFLCSELIIAICFFLETLPPVGGVTNSTRMRMVIYEHPCAGGRPTLLSKSTPYSGGTNSCFLKPSLRWRYKNQCRGNVGPMEQFWQISLLLENRLMHSKWGDVFLVVWVVLHILT